MLCGAGAGAGAGARRSRWALVVLALLLVGVQLPAGAFCPTNGYKCGFGGVGTTHKDMTEDVMEQLAREYFSVRRPTKSMKNAIEEVWQANAEVDLNQVDGHWHFDGESFATGKSRVHNLMNGVIRALQANDGVGARQQLGQALHTLQDFYSHTNFIESGNRGAYRAIWSGDVPFSPIAAPEETTCIPCELVQDPVSGSTHLDCSANIVTSKLTSGYYGGENEVPPHSRKCRHGGIFDTGPGPLGGINKDVIFETFAPHNFLHFPAASSARQATEQFIRDIRAQLTDRELKLLFGVGPTLAFAIDTTGSMGSVIAQVRAQVNQIVDARLGTDQEPLRYVLSPFNDPGVGPLTITDDPAEFKRAINALSANGGGDCPELAMQGQLAALYAADKGIDLFTFTDADAKDAGRAGAVSSLAASKDAKIYPILNGACSYGVSALANQPAADKRAPSHDIAKWGPLVDPAFRRIAEESGGQLFLLGTAEIGRVTQLVDAAARANAVDLLSVSDRAAGAERSYPVMVDSQLERISFSLSGSSALRVMGPDGEARVPGMAGVSEIPLSTGRIIEVLAPEPGEWVAAVGGSGAYSLSVLGEGQVALDRFDFVEEAGRPGHQGLFPIDGYPVVGESSRVSAQLSGEVESASFELLHRDGSLLQALDLRREVDGSQHEWFGTLTLPASPFVVRVSGTLVGGEPFQRVKPSMTRPQSVRVIAPVAESLLPGSTRSYRFEVVNHGEPSEFRFRVDDSEGFAQTPVPERFHLGRGEGIEVTVDLRVPATLDAELTHTLTATVESTVDPDVRNFAVLRSRLALSTVDCSAATASTSRLWPANHRFVPIAIDGVRSSDGAAVSVVVDAVLQNEPTTGAGSGATCPDARGVGTATPELRAERSGTGQGRIYSVLFSASNTVGSRCTGRVDVCVPHSQGGSCPDETPSLDSTVCH